MKKSHWILIGITCAFLCVLTGIFIGRNLIHTYVPVDKVLGSQATSPSGAVQNQDGKIDINTASLQQLQLLPGIGETIAQRIIDYRTEHGRFDSIEMLMNVSGIGEKKFEQIKPYIKAGGNNENSGS